MNHKITLDITILLSCVTGMVLSYVYLDNSIEKNVGLLTLGMLGVFFLILLVNDSSRSKRSGMLRYYTVRTEISEIQLLGEDNNITDIWDIYGKTSIVFGKDERENQVDISLKSTDYAGTVDGEHAVMNFSNGSWYIEDLDSENGTRIQRKGEDNPYRVSSREPCKVEKGDIIYLGLAPLKIR